METLPKVTNIYLNALLMILIPLVYGLGRAYHDGNLIHYSDLINCLWSYSEYTVWPLLFGWIGMDRTTAADAWTKTITNIKKDKE